MVKFQGRAVKLPVGIQLDVSIYQTAKLDPSNRWTFLQESKNWVAQLFLLDLSCWGLGSLVEVSIVFS